VTHLLANITWHSLAGPHSRYSTGTTDARRYARGFSPIVGFQSVEDPNFDGLAAYCEHGEHFYCDGWSGREPGGWRIESESTMFKMVWDAADDVADLAPEATPLGSQHALQAMELATLTQPGPFGVRTIELGDYFGIFDGQRLVAMAGERMNAGALREISGVCTHPDFQGRGLARRLVAKLIHRQRGRHETSFLHVMADNRVARALYGRMGFRDHQQSVVRVIARG
jgi:ribosomal protein S18 acetylase RimI-like enzyme